MRDGISRAIIHTAGRSDIDSEMMTELKNICKRNQTRRDLFVADAIPASTLLRGRRNFFKEINFTGIVLTKMDGDARGGAALSVLSVTASRYFHRSR